MQTRLVQRRDLSGHKDHQILAQKFPRFSSTRLRELTQCLALRSTKNSKDVSFTLRSSYETSETFIGATWTHHVLSLNQLQLISWFLNALSFSRRDAFLIFYIKRYSEKLQSWRLLCFITIWHTFRTLSKLMNNKYIIVLLLLVFYNRCEVSLWLATQNYLSSIKILPVTDHCR